MVDLIIFFKSCNDLASVTGSFAVSGTSGASFFLAVDKRSIKSTFNPAGDKPRFFNSARSSTTYISSGEGSFLIAGQVFT